MDEITDRVSKISKKVERLIQRYNLAKQENKQLKNQIQEFRKNLADQQNQIQALEKNLKLLKVTQSVEKGKGTKEAIIKIDELVREIDKCIELINN